MVSEDEKRRILRERRAAKIKNSSQRLGRITGERPGFEQEEQEEKVEQVEQKIEQKVEKATSRRISQTFAHDDPEIEDISKIDTIQEEEAKEFQKALQQYLSSEHHKHEDTDPSMDLFNKLMSGSQLNEPLNTTPLNPEELEYTQKLIEYNKQENDKSKAKFLLFKLITFTLLTLYSFFIENYKSSFNSTIRFNQVLNSSEFFKIFISLEILFTSFYAYKITNLPDNEYTFSFAKILEYLQYIPDQFLPQVWRNRIRLVVKYLDLLQLILFDFAIVFVVLGFLSYLN